MGLKAIVWIKNELSSLKGFLNNWLSLHKKMAMKHLSFLVLLTLSLLFLSSCSSEDEKLIESGVSIQLANLRQANLSNIEYSLEITVPRGIDKPVRGMEEISLHIKEISNPVILDFKAPSENIKKVEVNGEIVPINHKNEHLIVDKENLKAGANTILIDFQVGETSLNRNPDYLYTLFVPERARTAFPCFDQPNLKATYALTLNIPEEWQAISNGPLLEESLEGKSKVLKFKPTEPISSYLFDFVVGDFMVVERELDGRKMKMLHRETDSLKVARNLDAIFDLHLSSLRWLETYTNIPYPFQKFDFALIPSFQYGGMEHPGAITYKASSLFLEESPTQNQLLGRASLIAHEIAHMWFGDLVTMDWFNDVWMKEVFANFMAAKIVNPSFPDINHDLRFLLAHYPRAYAVDRSKGTHPIQQPLENLKDAGTLYGAIIYQKAPIVMRMLERKVGDSLFRNGMRTYLTDFAYSNATWDDLIAVLDSLSEDNLTEWSEQWIKSPGMPYISPFLRTDDGKIKQFSIYQRNTVSNDILWTQNLRVQLMANDTTYTYEVELEDNGLNIDEAKGLRDASFIFCNSAGYGYGYFRQGPLTKERWLDHIEDFSDPVQRGAGWISLWESFVRGGIGQGAMLSTITRNLKIEEDPLIQQYILGRLDLLYWRFLTNEQRLSIAPSVEELLWSLLTDNANGKLKRSYFNTFRSVALTEVGKQRLYDLWSKNLFIEGLSLSENDRAQLSFALALREYPKSDEVLTTQLANLTNPDRKARFEFLMPSVSSNAETRDTFFESLKQEKNREHESWVQTAIGYLNHPLRAESAVKYISPTLEMLEEIQMTGDIFFPKRVLDNTFSGHNSTDAIDKVNQFLYRNNHYPENLKNKILQSYDLSFRAEEILATTKDSIIVID
jgi:aminopeptidase N